MRYFTLLICLISFISLNAAAKASKTRKPASFDKAEAVIAFGDQQTSFRLWKEKNKNMYYFTSTNRSPASKELSNKDYEFLSKRISGLLAQESNDLQYCGRSNMTLTVVTKDKTVKKMACIGSKTPIAKDFTKFANSLSLVQ